MDAFIGGDAWIACSWCLQLFVRSGDDFGERVQDDLGNVIMAEEDFDPNKEPAVVVRDELRACSYSSPSKHIIVLC